MNYLKELALTAIIVLALAAAGCAGIFPTPAPTLPPEVIYTQAAETVIAALTQSAPPATATPTIPAATDTPVATASPQPSDTLLPTQTSLPSPTPTQPATPTLDTASQVYFEDFSGDSGWAEQSNESWRIGQANSAYAIHVKISYAPIWSVRNQEFEDMWLEVDAARTDGPENGYYGLVCRHVNADNYYALVIGSDGFYGIAIKEGGEKLRYLVEGRDQAGVISPGNASNRIRGDCIGSSLSIFANGQKLAETQDSTFDSGDTGLLAGTLAETGLQVLFDNFAIYIP